MFGSYKGVWIWVLEGEFGSIWAAERRTPPPNVVVVIGLIFWRCCGDWVACGCVWFAFG